jgi:hypothetical protein
LPPTPSTWRSSVVSDDSLRADLRQARAAVEEGWQMHADASDRMHDLKIIGVVGDQAVPDVLRRRLLAQVGQISQPSAVTVSS